MIQPGQKLAADFTLQVIQGDVQRTVVFRELLTRPTIVSVYMRNRTPSCDRQVDALVAHAAELDRLGYNLIALSRDTGGSHRNYAAQKGVPFILASDPDDTFAHAADSMIEKRMYGRTYLGPARAAFVLGSDGRVLAVVPKVDTKDHAAQLSAVLATL